jgi:hypothetical protein
MRKNGIVDRFNGGERAAGIGLAQQLPVFFRHLQVFDRGSGLSRKRSRTLSK